MYLARLKQALDQEEAKGLYRAPSGQVSFLRGIEGEILADMMGYLRRFNRMADRLPAGKSEIYKEYFRENLRPFLRTSPLMAGIIDKEHGYSGDFETVKQFFQNPYCGDSLFAKAMNKFHFSTDALLAHQERIDFLYDELCAAYQKASGGFSFLSLGSGPAEEVLRFLAKNRLRKPIHASLLDGDAYALADFSERLQYLRTESFTADLVNLNIMDLIRDREAVPTDGRYQLAYCAGLFDYLSKAACRRLVRYMIGRTKPGGTLIVTNVHRNNEMRHYMDYCGGWRIIHRDEGELEALVPSGYQTELHYDENRTNIFMKVNIP
jgi:extracellular factor (EF) 3-hydroxypalmitic acid methyl ester biosynthesis protein